MDIPHWITAWEEIIAPMTTQHQLLLACDFDGTLAPIAETPWEASLSEDTRQLLRKLSYSPGLTLAFISGRELADLKAQVALDNVIYCGNHGMQIEGPGFGWESRDAHDHRPELASAISEVRDQVAEMSGIIVEDKGLTASVHWRLASEENQRRLHPLVATIANTYPGLRLTYGKAVWEFRPRVGRNKGTALKYLLNRSDLTDVSAIYLGDDHTDEVAFEAIPSGVTIRVGPLAPTSARFSATDSIDVAGFLFCVFANRATSPTE